MKVYIVLFLATTALAAITSSNNAQTSHVKDVEDTHALAEDQLGWTPEADNQLSNTR